VKELIKNFMNLFQSNERSHGMWDPNVKDRDPHITIEKAYTEKQFEDHLLGKVGLGLVPIMDDGYCWWGAIDVDAHGEEEEKVDLVSLEALIRINDLPLNLCRSKSGGAHLYVFCIEPIKAPLLRKALFKWSELLGFGGAEIFPKQAKLLRNQDGSLQLGNYINLCNYDIYAKSPLRYSVDGGKQISLEHFIDNANSRRINAVSLVEMIDESHDNAPPCVRSMITNGVSSGLRNLSLYNIVIYLKRAFPETWKDKSFDMNAKIFDDPLSYTEAKKIVASASRREYHYKCKEEPCKSLCKSTICVTKKYGITPDEKDELEIGKAPEFSSLKKLLTEPVKWILTIDHNELFLSTPELMDFRKIREMVAEKMTMIVPPMKNDRWQTILHKLMKDTQVLEAPDDASTPGLVRSKLREFLGKARTPEKGKISKQDRQGLKLGMPVVQQEDNGQKFICFRGMDFVSFLKKSRSEELKGTNLWMALRGAGVSHKKMRIGESVIQVWYLKFDDEGAGDLIPPKIRTEF
jgi:hypothetical protein